MKRYSLYLLLLLLSSCSFNSSDEGSEKEAATNEDKLISKARPNEHFFRSRNYPDLTLDDRAYRAAMQSVSAQMMPLHRSDSTGRQAPWRLEGPTNIGGRINTIAVEPQNHDVIYAGCAAGGIFKTEDGGQSWLPIFDEQAYLAVGDVALDPQDPQRVWAGTGDPNIGGYSFIGNGIYFSPDGGQTWQHKGLEQTGVVTHVRIHPQDSLTIYAATMGNFFIKDQNRGLYKTTDGGQTWQQALFVDDDAGIIDLVVDPQHPDTLFAASFNRFRTFDQSIATGSDAKIWRSYDGGQSWQELNPGFPSNNNSRIGLEMSQQTPGKLLAVLVDSGYEFGGLFQTTDYGDSWLPLNDLGLSDALSDFGWYFGKVRMNPWNDNEVQVLGVDLWKNQDVTGEPWQMGAPIWWTYEVHADKHDLVYLDSTTYLLATDGGLYKTVNSGQSWFDLEDIPNTQFYHVAVNPHQPGVYYGGAQDNGTSKGSAVAPAAWPRIYGGDGFQPGFFPENPQLLVAETQNGNIEIISNEQTIINSLEPQDSYTNWNTPYEISRHAPMRMYSGGNKLYSVSNAQWGSWRNMTGLLTKNVSDFATLSTISESPISEELLYVGTSDGNIWRMKSDGSNLTQVNSGLPNRYVTSVVASGRELETVFVTFSGYRFNDPFPHVYKSTDKGATWEAVAGDLPQVAVNDLVEYPHQEGVYFVATDAGVYVTVDDGQHWQRMGSGMPVIPVFDIDFDPYEFRLVAGTFARSIMTFDLEEILERPKVAISQQQQPKFQFNLFPNPAGDIVQIEWLSPSPASTAWTLFDLQGRQVLNGHSSATGSFQIDVHSLESGTYFLHLNSTAGVATKRLLKM